jgi:hypothetical protein
VGGSSQTGDVDLRVDIHSIRLAVSSNCSYVQAGYGSSLNRAPLFLSFRLQRCRTMTEISLCHEIIFLKIYLLFWLNLEHLLRGGTIKCNFSFKCSFPPPFSIFYSLVSFLICSQSQTRLYRIRDGGRATSNSYRLPSTASAAK